MNKELLKEKGLKCTRSRDMILTILEQAKEPMNAEEIFFILRQEKELNFSTVYRTLSALTKKSILLKNPGADGRAYYQLNHHTHSHYLVCSGCRKRIAIEECPLELIGENLEKKTGFHITGHNLEFVGECPECMENLKKEK